MTRRKRLATAVMFAMINLLGFANSEATPLDDDWTDDDVIECLDRTEAQAAGPSRMLGIASRVAHEHIDAAWIARRAQSAAAVQQLPEHVAVIDLAVTSIEPQWRELLKRAIDFCQNQDVVKVIIQSSGVAPEQIIAVTMARGCQFARIRDDGGGEMIELYLNVYGRRKLSDMD